MNLRVAVGCLLAPSLSAQLYTTDAGVQSPDLPSLRERIEWSMRRDADTWRSETRLTWSPARELQLDLTLPFVAREVDGAVGGAQAGLGDALLAAKLALVRDDDVMRSDRLSLLLDVQLPTGDDDGGFDGQDLGPRAALGLGTWGAAVGIAGTIVRDRHRAALALRCWQFADHDGFAPGSLLSTDLAWWYRLTPSAFAPHDDELELRVTAELRARWLADDRLGGNDVGNGGGELQFVAGLQLHPSPAVAFEVGLAVPLAATTTSPFGDEHFGALCSCRISF